MTRMSRRTQSGSSLIGRVIVVIVLGAGIGMALGAVLGSVNVGTALGALIGLIAGVALELLRRRKGKR